MFKKIAIAVSLVLALSLPAFAQPPQQQGTEMGGGGSAAVHMEQTAPMQVIVPIQGSLSISTKDAFKISNTESIKVKEDLNIRSFELEKSSYFSKSDLDAGFIVVDYDRNSCFGCSSTDLDAAAGFIDYDKMKAANRFELEKFSLDKSKTVDIDKTFELSHVKTFDLNVLGQVGINVVTPGSQELCASAKGGSELEGRHLHDVAAGQLGAFAASQGYDYAGTYAQSLSVPMTGGGAFNANQSAAWNGSAYQRAVGGTAAVNVAW
jgi:hypothetical protein